jgi:hypothetical protein
VFPLAFAAVLGRAVKAYTTWRLERGETLGNLDTLAGSATLVSTIMSQVSLRIFTSLGAILSVAWMLSPLGGQAALRIVSLANVTDSANASYLYPKGGHVYGMGDIFMTSTSATEKGMGQALYASSLMSAKSLEQSSVDLWTNVKIPYLEHAEQNISNPADPEGWYILGDGGYEVASLVGIPVFGLPEGVHNSSFLMDASYWHVDCSSSTMEWAGPLPSPNSSWEGGKGESSVALWSNNTEYRGDLQTSSFPSNLSSRTILFRAFPIESICHMSTSYVELDLSCTSQLCRCVKIRRSVKQHHPENWTSLDLNFSTGSSNTIFAGFAYWFTKLVPGHDSKPTIVEGYFESSGPLVRSRKRTSISSLPLDLLSLRLAQILNTAWAASWVWIFNGVTGTSQLHPESLMTAAGVQTTAVEQISCDYLWFSILLIASLTMLSAAVACAAFRMLRRGPEFDLLISTMVKEDPNVSLPAMSSTLDAVERARNCKNVKIILGDVSGEDEVGHIALTNVGGRNAIGISKNRLYN